MAFGNWRAFVLDYVVAILSLFFSDTNNRSATTDECHGDKTKSIIK